jgi:hypothetical protein
MSIRYNGAVHKKGNRVLAMFKPGTVDCAKTFVISNQRYVYLLLVRLDDHPEHIIKFMPQDVEILKNNL